MPVGTAGSAQKRAHMRGVGVADVTSSRSTDFADVLGPAHPQGPVRMLLNSLTSPGMMPGVAMHRRSHQGLQAEKAVRGRG